MPTLTAPTEDAPTQDAITQDANTQEAITQEVNTPEAITGNEPLLVPSGKQAELSDQQFIDAIYDIALDPGNLNQFIDRLEAEAAELDSAALHLGRVETLSALFESHLSRAESFLDRFDKSDNQSPSEKLFAPFESSPALLINTELLISACNTKAQNTFAVTAGDSIDELPVIAEDADRLFTVLRQLQRDRTGKGVLLSLKLQESANKGDESALFHAHWLDIDSLDSKKVAGRHGFVLLVSTRFSWPLALEQTLKEVFGLTTAEQDIVRSLVEGHSLKSIAHNRDRSVGTVRTQVKSVLAKTRTHSQSELILVTLSLMQIVAQSAIVGASASVDTLAPATFSSITRPDGRNVDYLVQGDPVGTPIIFSHMGYGLLRWPPAALDLAAQYHLKIISPVRPGFGNSDPVTKDADILKTVREDTLAILNQLDVDVCPYVSQGNDLIFTMDFAANYPQQVSHIIGLGPRFPLQSTIQYPGMGKWHRFLLSTARHAPHLLYFTAKAAFTLAQKIGRDQMFRNVHRSSPADLAVLDDPAVFPTLLESSTLSVSDNHHAAFAYAKELFATESNWSDLVSRVRETPAWYCSGTQDPLGDPSVIAAYRETYPWLEIEVRQNAGQLLFFQQFEYLIPKIAAAAQQSGSQKQSHTPSGV